MTTLQASPLEKEVSAWSPNQNLEPLIPLGCVTMGQALPFSEPQ